MHRVHARAYWRSIAFTRRYVPRALPLVCGHLALEILIRVLSGERRQARALLNALTGARRQRLWRLEHE